MSFRLYYVDATYKQERPGGVIGCGSVCKTPLEAFKAKCNYESMNHVAFVTVRTQYYGH